MHVKSNASLYTMDFTMTSSSIFVDGILKIVYFFDPMSMFSSIVNTDFPNTFPPHECANTQPVLFTSGRVQGAGYVVFIEKSIKFASQASSALHWTGPTLLLKFDSVFESSTFAVIDADIVFEHAKVKTCTAVTISSARGVFVKSVKVSAHELSFQIKQYYESWQYGSEQQAVTNSASLSSYMKSDACRESKSLTLKSKCENAMLNVFLFNEA